MKKWLCNNCDCSEFELEITGGYSTVKNFNSEGIPVEYYDDTEYSDECTCSNCGCKGELTEIARWVECI